MHLKFHPVMCLMFHCRSIYRQKCVDPVFYFLSGNRLEMCRMAYKVRSQLKISSNTMNFRQFIHSLELVSTLDVGIFAKKEVNRL
jgi:hypothetical protein